MSPFCSSSIAMKPLAVRTGVPAAKQTMGVGVMGVSVGGIGLGVGVGVGVLVGVGASGSLAHAKVVTTATAARKAITLLNRVAIAGFILMP